MAKLPKRFRPFLQQAKTETALRYGAQEAALRGLRSSAAHDYGQGLLVQHTATLGLLGALQAAPGQITQAYSSVGLSSPLLKSMVESGSPTAQRIASEQAAAVAGIAQQRAGAHAGEVAGVNRLTDQYNQDIGKIGSQQSALAREKGLFAQDLLDQLISSDRSARHAANVQFKRDQMTADRQSASDANALTRTLASGLLAQGLKPVINPDGTVSIGGPIPGAKSNRPKATGPRRATGSQISRFRTDFSTALQRAQAGTRGLPLTKANRHKLARLILGGADAAPKNQQLHDSATGRRKYSDQGAPLFIGPDGKPTTDPGGGGAIKGISNQAAVSAALDMVFDRHVSHANAKTLHSLGLKVADLPGAVSAGQYRRRLAASRPPGGRQSPLGSFHGQQRPT